MSKCPIDARHADVYNANVKIRNIFYYLLPVLLASIIFVPTKPASSADASWSALPMPQGSGAVVEWAISPNQNGLVYVLTFNTGHSLWRTNDDGNTWQRILQTGDSGLSSIERICLARDGTLYAAGSSGTGPTCLKSTDNGQSFTATTLPAEVDSTAGFAAFDSHRFFFSSFDGERSQVWRTSDGTSFENTAVSAVAFSVMELSPSFSTDNTLLTAGSDGNIYLSTDGGVTFSGLQQSPLSGDISVAFADDYASSKYIYAASRTAGAGIWRLRVGEPLWSRIDAGLPSGTIISGLSISANGAFYASSANQVSASSGGLARKTPDTSWDMVRSGLPAGATLWGLQSRGNKVYSLDTANNRLMTYTDSLVSPVELVSPPSGAPGLGAFSAGTVGGIDLIWQNPGGATTFQWQVSDIADMSVPRFEGTTASETYRLRNLEPGITYFWRVRVASPLAGPWSEVRNFTTALGSPLLLVPAPGATALTLLPPFQWQQAGGATTYELMLSVEANFQTLTAWPMGITGNVWQPKTALIPATAYFWKVRAISPNSFSPWSAVSAFNTAAPAPTTTAPTTTAPPTKTTAPAPSTTPVANTSPTTLPAHTTASAPSASLVKVNSTVPQELILIFIGLGSAAMVVLILVFTALKSRRK